MVLMACWCLYLWECIAQLETGTGGSCCLSSWGRQHGKKHIHGRMCFIFPSCVSIYYSIVVYFPQSAFSTLKVSQG